MGYCRGVRLLRGLEATIAGLVCFSGGEIVNECSTDVDGTLEVTRGRMCARTFERLNVDM